MKKLFLILLVIFSLTACSGAGIDVKGGWTLVSYGSVSNPTPALSDVDTFINFEADGNYNGNVGCNGFGGKYELKGDTITFSETMSTMMFCDATSAQEQAVLNLFADNVQLKTQMKDNVLTITSPDGGSIVALARK